MIPGLNRNAVIAASAGTGKTELLTSIYIGHCLGLAASRRALSPTRIVATTFSRAAAREIRERLEARFVAIAEGEESERERRLGAGLSARARALDISASELRRRARSALEELPDAAIDTLHNLCARILREHGLELGISPSFAILEEQRSLDETEHTIDEVLSDALGGSGTTALGARQLLDAAGGLDRLRGWMLALLSRLDDEGLDAGELERGDEAAGAARLGRALYDTCRELTSDPSSPRAPLARAVLDVLPNPGQAPSDPDRLSRAFAQLASEAKGRERAGSAALRALLERSRGRNNAERARAIVRLVVEGPSLDERVRGVAEVIEQIQTRLRQRHVAERRLGFGDLLRLTRDGLRDQPQVALAASRRIELLLVDEFQDTSRVQCDLLLLLRERPERCRARPPGALPQARDIAPEGLVVVGDRKQSIYGFRGADVSVFAELSVALAGPRAAELLDLPAAAVPTEAEPAVADVSTLVDSYRSDRAVIAAVNTIAARDFAPQLEQSFEIRYAAAEALRVPEARQEVGRGTLTLLRDDGRTPEGAAALLARASGSLRSALSIAGYCAREVAAGRTLGSFAILARRRATLPLLGFALDHFAVPYVVSGRDLYGTPEVRDVFAALRLTQTPRDRHALSIVARSPLGGLSDQALLELSEPRRGLTPFHDWQAERLSRPEDSLLAARLKQRLSTFLGSAPRLSPRDAIFELIELFELASVFARLPRGAVRLANLGRLQEIAATHGGNLAAFVRFVTRQIASEFDETEAALFSADEDAVRLLTIHGSKGLAFPTVILADAEAMELPQPAPVGILRRSGARPLLVVRHAGEDGPIITDNQNALGEDARARAQAERQRLSYVALTRARNELVIALPARARSGTLAKTVLELLDEGAFAAIDGFQELPTGELLAAPALGSPPPAESVEPPRPPPQPSSSAIVLGVTALSDFRICPRRFSLIELAGLSEPRRGASMTAEVDPALDPRLAGIAAHHVLEVWPLEHWGQPPNPAELARLLEQSGLAAASPTGQKTLAGLARFLGGNYAARVRREAVRVERELSLTVTLSSARPRDGAQLQLFSQDRATPLVVKATLDLLVELGDGSLHVVDYKRTRGGGGDHARYGPQLAFYRSVVRRQFGKTPQVGLLHLLGDADEPEWLEPEQLEPSEVADAFLAARAHDVWPPARETTCRAVHCGFVTSCHSGGAEV